MGRSAAWKSLSLVFACLLACAAPGLRAQGRPPASGHGIMRPDPAVFRRWQFERRQAPQASHAKAASGFRPADAQAPPASYTLIQSVPAYTDRNQGDCGSCWVWASTALTEVALRSQYGIHDRLSVQYFQSNDLVEAACWGGDLTEFCDWYNNNAQSPANPNPGVLVPWSNANGTYVDGTTAYFQMVSLVPPGGVGLQPRYSGLTLAHQTLDVYGASVSQEQAIADIQAALLNQQAVGFSFYTNFSASDGFDAFWSNQPGTATWINNYEGVTVPWPYDGWGGHMVTIVGWDATDPNPVNQYWIVLNQWGTTPTRLDECFRMPMYMNYGATYTMVDSFGNSYVYDCYGLETLTLSTPSGASPAGPAARPAGALPLPSGPALAGGILTLAPALTAGSPPFSYQWQVDLGKGQGLQAVAGATGEALCLPNDVIPGYGVLDGSWDGVQVALSITNGSGTSVLGPVSVHVAGSVQNPDSGFESGPLSGQWAWNDTVDSDPIVQYQPTHGGTYAASLTGQGFPAGSSGTLKSALVTLPADRTVPVVVTYFLCLSSQEWQPLVRATCTLQVVDAAGNVLQVLKTHTDMDVDHLSYLPESFDITALNQGGTRVALQAVWSDPDGLSLFLLDDAQIITGASDVVRPTVTGFTPAAAIGAPVTITGTHLTGASLVVFGRDHAQQWTVDSDTQITAVVPYSAATGPITVTTPAGTASSGATFYVAPLFITDPDCLGYDFNYGILNEMSPSFGAPGDVVQLIGFNFTGATSVTFGGVPATQFTVVSSSQVNATVPVGARSDAVEVIAPGGTARSNGAFTVGTAAAPSLALAAPAAANPEATVTLTGTGLATVNKVTFNGVSASSFLVTNDTTLAAIVPFGAGSGPVAVSNPAGTASIAFTVLPPAISSISSSGTTYPGTAISIHGTGFLDAGGLTIDGMPVSFNIVSNALVNAVIPPGIRPLAAVPVLLTSAEGASAPFMLNVYVPAPVCSSLAPGSGPAGTVVTCTGQYFTHAQEVAIGGVGVASFQVFSDTVLSFVVPAGAVTGTVLINSPFGSGTSATPFTVQAATVQVAIVQGPDNLLEGTTYGFSATVTGAAVTTVTWSVLEGAAGGAIDPAGLYTAPAAPGTYHVVATSTADPAAFATFLVPVHSACLNPGSGAGAAPTVIDLAYFVTALGSKVGDAKYLALADLNGDGVIDDADLTLFLAAF